MVNVDAQGEKQLIAELEDLVSRRTTAMADEVRLEPVASYIDPERAAHERELIFKRYPLVIATSVELPEPGDFTTSQLAGLPVLTVRGDDGQARCLVNICRHRGNRVCQQEAGNRRTFACDYHAWTYDRAGRLRSTVDREGFSDLPREEFGLVELPTDERYGLVWALPDPDGALNVPQYAGEDLAGELGDLELDQMVLYERSVLEQPFNWKLAADTFLEVFHLAYLHKRTIGPLFLGNVGAYHEWDLHHRFTAVRKSFAEMVAGPPEQQTIFPHSSLVHWIFPNTILTWQMDHIETWRFFPAPDRDDACIVEGAMLIDQAPVTDGAKRHWEKNWTILMKTILDEDFATMQRVQRNMETGAVRELAFGRNEVGLQHFHRALADELAAVGQV